MSSAATTRIGDLKLELKGIPQQVVRPVQHHPSTRCLGECPHPIGSAAHVGRRPQRQHGWHHVGHPLLLNTLRDAFRRHAAQGLKGRVAGLVRKRGDGDEVGVEIEDYFSAR
jgi:hypothetical protein